MVNPQYAVKCLHLGFDRYKRYCKLPITIKVSKSTVSFYVKKPSTPKGYDARVSDHHPNLQHYTDNGDEPWLNDNVSIEFIVPYSREDIKPYRARVEQNASGTIQPFDVTTYQYDSTLIDPTDITIIFKAIIVFLNGGGYTDPFIGTPKRAKVLPRHSNIKPHRGSASSTTLTCSRNISIDENYLNEMTIYCLGDIIPLNENKQYNKNRNMKQTIKLKESDLKRMIAESIRGTLKESNGNDTIDREWYSQKGAILDDEEEYIARYYNIFEKAYDSARKLYNFLNNTVNVHDIEYLRYQVRNSKDSDIQNAIYEALKAVNNAESKLHNVFYMMKELK